MIEFVEIKFPYVSEKDQKEPSIGTAEIHIPRISKIMTYGKRVVLVADQSFDIQDHNDVDEIREAISNYYQCVNGYKAAALTMQKTVTDKVVGM